MANSFARALLLGVTVCATAGRAENPVPLDEREQFSQPADHTIFQTTTAPRHNELAVNLVALGVEVAGLNGPIGRLYLQAGSNVETDWGQDASTQRGQFLTLRTFAPVQQAAAG